MTALSGFLHGVEVVTLSTGLRTITTQASSIIGIVGTAPDADDATFPLDTPVLVNSPGGYAGLGNSGTLKPALDGIFAQDNCFVVVIRVDVGASADETMSNVIGGVDGVSGARTGISAFRDAKTKTGATPMLLGAPGFTSVRPVGLTGVAVTAQGSGYTSAPTVVFAGGGSASNKVLPTAHAVLGTGAAAGKVTSIVVDTPGAHIDNTLTVSLTGGAGTGATATATVTNYANPVATALVSVASTLRAHVVVAGPNTTDADAITYRGDFGSRRLYIVDPFVKVYDTATSTYVSRDNAGHVLGVIARTDRTEGFWKSPSNELINGIGGLDRAVDYALGDPNTRANLLNANQVTTIIRDDGWYLWGNRTCAQNDDTFAFLCVSRTADMIDLSIQAAHKWACDQVITKAYVDTVVSSVNAYIRQLVARGAILGGKCWFDPDKNADADIIAGHVTFSYEFTPTYPSERVTFESSIVDTYISSLFAAS